MFIEIHYWMLFLDPSMSSLKNLTELGFPDSDEILCPGRLLTSIKILAPLYMLLLILLIVVLIEKSLAAGNQEAYGYIAIGIILIPLCIISLDAFDTLESIHDSNNGPLIKRGECVVNTLERRANSSAFKVEEYKRLISKAEPIMADQLADKLKGAVSSLHEAEDAFDDAKNTLAVFRCMIDKCQMSEMDETHCAREYAETRCLRRLTKVVTRQWESGEIGDVMPKPDEILNQPI